MKAKVTTVALLLVVLGSAAVGQETAQRQVHVSMFEAQVRSFAPGIDAIIGLTDDQAKLLAAAYRGAFETSGVNLANMVLRDNNTTLAQRQMATATLQQAQATFRAQGRAIFTEEQRQLIDKVYASFASVQETAQKEMVAKITTGFAKELDGILTPEQKQAMQKAKAQIEEAARKAAEEKAKKEAQPKEEQPKQGDG